MEQKVKFGTEEHTKVIDENGSTATTTVSYYDGKPQPTKVTYKLRHRADKKDMLTLEKIAHDLLNDPAKLNPSIWFEKSPSGDKQGSYDLIECYTLIEMR